MKIVAFKFETLPEKVKKKKKTKNHLTVFEFKIVYFLTRKKYYPQFFNLLISGIYMKIQ